MISVEWLLYPVGPRCIGSEAVQDYARTRSENQVEQIAFSIKECEWKQPVLVDDRLEFWLGIVAYMDSSKSSGGFAKVSYSASTTILCTDRRQGALTLNTGVATSA